MAGVYGYGLFLLLNVENCKVKMADPSIFLLSLHPIHLYIVVHANHVPPSTTRGCYRLYLVLKHWSSIGFNTPMHSFG